MKKKRESIPSFLIYITNFLTDIETLASDRHIQTDRQTQRAVLKLNENKSVEAVNPVFFFGGG
jgi:hypothetical protein